MLHAGYQREAWEGSQKHESQKQIPSRRATGRSLIQTKDRTNPHGQSVGRTTLELGFIVEICHASPIHRVLLEKRRAPLRGHGVQLPLCLTQRRAVLQCARVPSACWRVPDVQGPAGARQLTKDNARRQASKQQGSQEQLCVYVARAEGSMVVGRRR